MKKKTLSVIIPVYQNAGTLIQTYNNLVTIFTQLKKTYDYEVIFINDGSTDSSYTELLSIRKKNKKIKVINFARNFGQLSAIQAGFEFSGGDLLINISADMQDPASLILDMVERWERGYKIVLCARKGREDGFIAKITSKIFYHIVSASYPHMPNNGFDYFLLDKDVYKQLLKFNERNYFLQGNILWTGYEPAIIYYKRQKRTVGKSQWSLTKKLKYFLDGFISASYIPMRVMSFLGIMFSFFAFLYTFTILYLWFFQKTPFQGYAPIMMVLLWSSGLTMTMLGIMGEYIWRTYDQVRNRPMYIIKEIIK